MVPHVSAGLLRKFKLAMCMHIVALSIHKAALYLLKGVLSMHRGSLYMLKGISCMLKVFLYLLKGALYMLKVTLSIYKVGSNSLKRLKYVVFEGKEGKIGVMPCFTLGVGFVKGR